MVAQVSEVREPIDAGARRIEFVKGHGTENDFVLLPDPHNDLHLTDAQARLICNRRAGIGADGVIRIGTAPDGSFLMDYRNADGSLAEMCGNGARVFTAFLYDRGWIPAGPFTFATRSGRRSAERTADGRIAVGMGPAHVGPPSSAQVLLVDGTAVTYAGTSVDVGNPHLVSVVDVPLHRLDLVRPPQYPAEQFPAGVNLEFVAVDGTGAVSMRVHERGVGETRSCGTGTVAVAAVQLRSRGLDTGSVTVRTLGGPVDVEISADDSVLTGPAELVGSGFLEPAWWQRHNSTVDTVDTVDG